MLFFNYHSFCSLISLVHSFSGYLVCFQGLQKDSFLPVANVEAEDAVTVEWVEEDGEEVLLQARLLTNQNIQLEE